MDGIPTNFLALQTDEVTGTGKEAAQPGEHGLSRGLRKRPSAGRVDRAACSGRQEHRFQYFGHGL